MKLSFNQKYWILKLKAYFDKGFSINHYPRYILLAWLMKEFNTGKYFRGSIITIIYGIYCFWFGYLWYKWDWILAEHEVQNKFNLLAIEIRKHLKNKKF